MEPTGSRITIWTTALSVTPSVAMSRSKLPSAATHGLRPTSVRVGPGTTWLAGDPDRTRAGPTDRPDEAATGAHASQSVPSTATAATTPASRRRSSTTARRTTAAGISEAV